MKFTMGYGANLPGITSSDVAQIKDTKLELRDGAESLNLFTVNYNGYEKAFGGPAIEVSVSAPVPDVIRIEAVHFRGIKNKGPEFEIGTAPGKLDYDETEDTITVRSGNTSVVINKNPASFKFYYCDRLLTSVGERNGSSMISYMNTPDGSYIRTQLNVDIGEKLYGLGERFTPFVKNGQVVDIWNEDGGTCSEIAYKNIPFYISNKGYGVFVNSPDKVSYELCSEMVTRAQFSVPGEKMDFMVIGGRDLKNVLENYTTLTGKPSLPPAWSFGLWLTSSFLTSYDEDIVMSMVDGMMSRDIPLHVFHFDAYWMKEQEWCGFEWDGSIFPDPEKLIDKIHDRGIRVCVWINPYIGQKSSSFSEAAESGYLLKRPNGDIWQTDLWQAGMGIVDFTNPAAYKWYQDKLKALVDVGVDCFKSDFGERIPVDVAYFDGSDPQKMHNYYTYLYNKCVFELLERERGKNEACLFARSATVGGQKFPVHWGGDCLANYPSMSETLRGGLSLTLSGFGYWSHDIAGFEGNIEPDIYKRWSAFGLLSSHSRFHGAGSYKVPWLYGEESVDVVRSFAKLKCSLMPYIWAQAVKTHMTGVPMMRAMVLEFSDDRCTWDLDLQYMFGDSLLVAPVFSESGNVEYYLPKGRWTDWFTGDVKEGGRFLREHHGYMTLPLLVRENSIIAVGSCDMFTEYEYADSVTLRCYEISDAECTILNTDCDVVLVDKAVRSGNDVIHSFKGELRDVSLLLVNIHKVDNLAGGVSEDTPEGLVISVCDSTVRYTVV